jgi:hypothetical protein
MLAHFQQALADLVAAPDRCQAVRDGDVDHLDGYDLTALERTRLVAIANHGKMAANCAVYRSNRLTPIVINLPDTCAALGEHLRDVVDRFWAAHPTQHFVHFLVESERFADFVDALDDLPAHIATAVNNALTREAAVVRQRLAESLA